jgi:hypothetical protein
MRRVPLSLNILPQYVPVTQAEILHFRLGWLVRPVSATLYLYSTKPFDVNGDITKTLEYLTPTE